MADTIALDNEASVDDATLAEFHPDIHTLFRIYNQQYFESMLDVCELEWSERMTLCAGICYSKRREGVMHCTIRLSKPLLQFRPFSDTINTLLHEMIHAYIFVKFGGTLHRDGHGPDFQAIMNRINRAAGSNITVYHTFHAEVRACRTHVWRCQGQCQNMAPFYGWCRRSMNRAPSPSDWWWSHHDRTCGGKYIKVSEPEGYKAKQAKKRPPVNPITAYFKGLGTARKLGDSLTEGHNPKRKNPVKTGSNSPKKPEKASYFDSLKGSGQKLGSDIEIITASLVVPSNESIDLTLDD